MSRVRPQRCARYGWWMRSRHLTALLLALPVVAHAQPVPPDPVAERPAPVAEPPAPPPPPPDAPPPPDDPPAAAITPPPGPSMPLPAAAASPADGGGDTTAQRYHATGLLFGVQLELTPIALGAGLVLEQPSTHLLVGYQAADLAVGVTVDLARQRASFADGRSTATTTAMVGPLFIGTLARSETGRTELLAVASVGYRIYDGEGSDRHRITGRLGPSLRYWVSPSFAIAATSGLRLDDLVQNDNSHVIVAIGHALDLVGVF